MGPLRTTNSVVLAMLAISAHPTAAQTVDSAVVVIAQTAAYPARSIVGYVYDVASTRPLVGAQVIATGSSEGAITDSVGRFRFVVSRTGLWELTAQHIGYDAALFRVTVSQDSAVAATVGLYQTVVPICGNVICMGPFGCYDAAVTVRDFVTGRAPSVPATLRVVGPTQADSFTHAGGLESSRELNLGAGERLNETGRFALEVSAPGYVTWRLEGVRRDVCRVFRPSPIPVMLVPQGKESGAADESGRATSGSNSR